MSTIRVERRDTIAVVTIERPQVRNAVDGPTALALADAFRAFDADAQQLGALPQRCLRSDRLSAYEQWSLPFADAMRNEYWRGRNVIASGETETGAARFVGGEGRHGAPAGQVTARQ